MDRQLEVKLSLYPSVNSLDYKKEKPPVSHREGTFLPFLLGKTALFRQHGKCWFVTEEGLESEGYLEYFPSLLHLPNQTRTNAGRLLRFCRGTRRSWLSMSFTYGGKKINKPKNPKKAQSIEPRFPDCERAGNAAALQQLHLSHLPAKKAISFANALEKAVS